MKPFNLQEALAGKPVVTRDGRKVTEIKHFKTATDSYQDVVAVVAGRIQEFTLSGSFYSMGGALSTYDLFMDSTQKTGWINLYKGKDQYSSGNLHVHTGYGLYSTHKDAYEYRAPSLYIATVEVTWEE